MEPEASAPLMALSRMAVSQAVIAFKRLHASALPSHFVERVTPAVTALYGDVHLAHKYTESGALPSPDSGSSSAFVSRRWLVHVFLAGVCLLAS